MVCVFLKRRVVNKAETCSLGSSSSNTLLLSGQQRQTCVRWSLHELQDNMKQRSIFGTLGLLIWEPGGEKDCVISCGMASDSPAENLPSTCYQLERHKSTHRARQSRFLQPWCTNALKGKYFKVHKHNISVFKKDVTTKQCLTWVWCLFAC